MDVPQNLHVARRQGTGTPDLDKPRERGPPHPSSCEQRDFWRTGQAVLGEWAAVAAAFRAFPWLGRAGMWKTWSARHVIAEQSQQGGRSTLPCCPPACRATRSLQNREVTQLIQRYLLLRSSCLCSFQIFRTFSAPCVNVPNTGMFFPVTSNLYPFSMACFSAHGLQ